jgi:hypothetical protein
MHALPASLLDRSLAFQTDHGTNGRMTAGGCNSGNARQLVASLAVNVQNRYLTSSDGFNA